MPLAVIPAEVQGQYYAFFFQLIPTQYLKLLKCFFQKLLVDIAFVSFIISEKENSA